MNDMTQKQKQKPRRNNPFGSRPASMSVLSSLDFHPCLRARIHRVHPPPPSTKPFATLKNDASTAAALSDEGFVLYLPTVCLRYEQNPSFALACHAANRLNVPLVVLAVVVDDASHACAAQPHRYPPIDSNSSSLSPSVVMTSRRLAFTLQALSHACTLWSEHGAAVGVRIHAANNPSSSLKGARTPDHLTLASRASLVVTDEPFVSPFTTFVHRVEEACRKSNVECIRVDGSCTVPPVQVLKRRPNSAGGNNSKIQYDGVPGKANQWQRKTESLREGHLKAAVEGYFDAPELTVKMEDEDLFAPVGKQEEKSSSMNDLSMGQRLAHLFPSRWKPIPLIEIDANGDGDAESSSLPSAPDVRPFTSRELSHLYQNDDYVTGDATNKDENFQHQSITSTTQQDNKQPFHRFALSWPGADPTVPPCPQTIGTTPHGMNRWNNFMQKKLSSYGKERNDAKLVHAPSRMSAYLNLGIVSIFRVVWEVKRTQKQQSNGQPAKSKSRWDKSGADKFEEEIVKFREMSYAHAFSREDYDDITSLPRWSVTCLNSHPNRSRYTMEQLANGMTGDAKWDAMQQYLVRTGELHNNVRMTWGKTVNEWVGCRYLSAANDIHYSSPAQLTLRALCYLNDRYALDGLSPPSYAGLLWCIGWSDKPSSGNSSEWNISKKPAYRYRMNPEDFRGAEQKLLASRSSQDGGCESSNVNAGGSMKRQRSVLDMMKMQSSSSASTASSPAAAAIVDLTASEDGNSKESTESVKSSKASKGMKRNASFTIDSFFSKTGKKSATEKCKRIVG